MSHCDGESYTDEIATSLLTGWSKKRLSVRICLSYTLVECTIHQDRMNYYTNWKQPTRKLLIQQPKNSSLRSLGIQAYKLPRCRFYTEIIALNQSGVLAFYGYNGKGETDVFFHISTTLPFSFFFLSSSFLLLLLLTHMKKSKCFLVYFQKTCECILHGCHLKTFT